MLLDEYSFEEIYAHLKEIDSAFIPRLSETLDLDEYARKIFDKAEIYGKREDLDAESAQLVALLAVYVNKDFSYITHVGVLPEFQGEGLAQGMLTELIADVGARKIALEVDKHNIPAIRLYQKNGFEIIDSWGPNWRMERVGESAS